MMTHKIFISSLAIGTVLTLLFYYYVPLQPEQAAIVLSISSTALSIQAAAVTFFYEKLREPLLRELINAIRAASMSETVKKKEFEMIRAMTETWKDPLHSLFVTLVSLLISVLCSAWSTFIGNIRILEGLALSGMFVGLFYLGLFIALLLLDIQRRTQTIERNIKQTL